MNKERRIIQLANYLDVNGNNYPYQGAYLLCSRNCTDIPSLCRRQYYSNEDSNMEVKTCTLYVWEGFE